MTTTPDQLAQIAGEVVLASVSLPNPPIGGWTAGALLERLAPGNGRFLAELLLAATEAGAMSERAQVR